MKSSSTPIKLSANIVAALETQILAYLQQEKPGLPNLEKEATALAEKIGRQAADQIYIKSARLGKTGQKREPIPTHVFDPRRYYNF